MRLIKKLQECATMGQADPILTKLGAGPAVKKLVETALALSSSQDPQQRNHAYSFMESAIKELEDDQGNLADSGLGPDVDDDIAAPKLREEEDERREKKIHEQDDDDERREKKMHEQDDDDNEHKVHEEVLDNHNNGPREEGSEQSTDNVAPYPQQGVDTTSGEKPMQDMDDTVNQWSETNGMIVPGVPPIQDTNGMGMNGMNGMSQPGLAPDIAQEMGMKMPAPPPMDTNQMMRQMQYTVRHEMKNYDRKVVAPMVRHMKAQREALNEQKKVIRKLSMEIRETKTSSGNMKLDLDFMRDNANAKFRETEFPTVPGFTGMGLDHTSSVAVQPLPNYQRVKVDVARSEIEQMDKMLNSNRNIYN